MKFDKLVEAYASILKKDKTLSQPFKEKDIVEFLINPTDEGDDGTEPDSIWKKGIIVQDYGSQDYDIRELSGRKKMHYAVLVNHIRSID